jgi:CRP/FNR family transcriptional regulator
MNRKPVKEVKPAEGCECAIHQRMLCGNSDPELREELRRVSRLRHFRKGETVLPDGEPPRMVGNVVSGVLRMQKTLPDGRQHIVGLLVPTDMFGRVFSGPSRFAIEAATDVTLCCFERRELEDMLRRHPVLEHGLMISVLDELDAAREWILLLGGHTVRERVATFLLIFARRWPNLGCGQQPVAEPRRVQIPISRRDMAQYLGARVETLSRAIHSLGADGLIEAEDSAHFRILDLPGLVAASGNTEFLDYIAPGPE